MKILFTLPRQHPNQAGWYHTLTQAGYDVRYIVSYSLPVNERGDLPTPHVIKESALPWLYRLLLRVYTRLTGNEAQKPYLQWPDKYILEEEIARFSPDIIIIRESLTPLALVTQAIARKRNIPTVHYSQAPLQKRDGFIHTLLRTLKVIPAIRMSPTLNPKSETYIPVPKNTFYVPLFVPAAVKEVREKSDGTLRLLFVGKFIRRKNHVLLLDAFAKIRKIYPTTLTMVGSTVFADTEYKQELTEKIQSLQNAEDITVLSDIPPEQMGDLYSTHDVFVLPSFAEPFSISPLEAMANGLPVIVTDTNGCQFHIRNGANGFVVKSDDLETLVESLKQFMDHEKLITMKRSALHYVQQNNNAENFLVQFNNLIAAVVHKPRTKK